MFKILGLMILGIIIGYGLRRISFLRKVEVSISYTVFLLLLWIIFFLSDGKQRYWLCRLP